GDITLQSRLPSSPLYSPFFLRRHWALPTRMSLIATPNAAHTLYAFKDSWRCGELMGMYIPGDTSGSYYSPDQAPVTPPGPGPGGFLGQIGGWIQDFRSITGIGGGGGMDGGMS